jgi:hypothetical protein
MTATPTMRLISAVNTLLDSGAPWLNGVATASTVARAVIQVKKASGRGAPSSSRFSTPVASSAQAAANTA